MEMKSETNTAKNLPLVGTLGFLSAVMVVALHMYQVYSFTVADGVGAYLIRYLSHGVATVAVPVFFGLSGFLFFRNVNSHRQIFGKIKKRLFSLVIPYIAWNILYFVYYIITAKMPFRNQEIMLDFSWKGIVEAVFFHKYIYNMWFLLNLIVLTYLFANLTFLLFSRKWTGRVICFGIVLLGCLGLGSLSVHVGASDIGVFTLSFGSYWFIGALISIQKIILPPVSKKMASVSLALWIICSIFVFFGKDDIRFTEATNVFVLLNTMFFLIAAAGFETHIHRPAQNMNMIIYGAHGLCSVLYLFAGQKLFAYIPQAVSGAAAVIYYLLGVAATVCICYYGGVLLKRFLPFVYKLFCGSR